MPKDIFPFLSIPGELRNMIYKFSVDWNDSQDRMAKLLEDTRSGKVPCPHIDNPIDDLPPPPGHLKHCPPYPKHTTPTVLLINRQITGEALWVLHKKPLRFHIPIVRSSSCPEYRHHPDQNKADMSPRSSILDFGPSFLLSRTVIRSIRETVFVVPSDVSVADREKCAHCVIL
ncbi:hypothetical protein K402DRAFT_34251 [Aulographum hederae CBS 113979]|uniref:Uncharacterized protein n=1 Tax=Aulographum hederae CBS 113979 TaxID=1176131 RepID=A0A6G1H5N6_9PEZI|nr:hypothetical protein K402DRAFT_34251 [Aulographum hederae CBS 113979]